MSIISELLKLGAKPLKKEVGKLLQTDIAPAFNRTIRSIIPTSEKKVLENVRQAAPEFFSQARAQGATFDPRANRFITNQDPGFMVSPIPNPVDGSNVAAQIDDLLSIVKQPEVMGQLRRGGYLGSWMDEARGGLVIDPSQRYATEEAAMNVGKRAAQDAIYDVGGERVIDVPENYASTNIIDFLKQTYGDAKLSKPKNSFSSIIKERYGNLSNPKAMVNPGGKSFIQSSGITPASQSTLDDLLGIVNKEGISTTTPSDLSKKITKEFDNVLSSETITNKAGDTTKYGVIRYDSKNIGKYPKDLQAVGLQPVQGYNYLAKDSSITKLPSQDIVKEELKSNIRALASNLGDPNFYNSISKAISSRRGVSPELGGGTFAPFSAGTLVKPNAVLQGRFLEDPTLYPGRNVGEGSRTAGNAWKQAIKAVINENPLDPFNFNQKGLLVKVPSFAENIGSPGTSLNATIDRHAVQAALGSRIGDDTIPDLSNPAVYTLFNKAYIEVAEELGMMPHELQSQVWDVWRSLMLKQPGAASPADLITPVKASDIFKLSPAKRKTRLSNEFNTIRKENSNLNITDEWMRSVGLI